MGDRKWEDLPIDCLVNIFASVEAVWLVNEVSYVCKSWFKATLNPFCWQTIIIPDDLPDRHPSDSFFETCQSRYGDWMYPFQSYNKNSDGCWVRYEECWLPFEFYMNDFAKLVIRRSRGLANVVVFPPSFCLKQEVLDYIVDECPSLKRLVLPNPKCKYDNVNLSHVTSVICKWKNLEALEVAGTYSLKELIHEISIHCKSFVSLSVYDAYIGRNEAFAIATQLPNIEFISLRGSWIKQSNLVIILKGCKKLVHLDSGSCFGFWGLGSYDEIRNLAAHISTFKFKASCKLAYELWRDHTLRGGSDINYDCDGAN